MHSARESGRIQRPSAPPIRSSEKLAIAHSPSRILTRVDRLMIHSKSDYKAHMWCHLVDILDIGFCKQSAPAYRDLAAKTPSRGYNI